MQTDFASLPLVSKRGLTRWQEFYNTFVSRVANKTPPKKPTNLHQVCSSASAQTVRLILAVQLLINTKQERVKANEEKKNKIENLKIQVYFSGVPEEWERCFCWTSIRRTKRDSGGMMLRVCWMSSVTHNNLISSWYFCLWVCWVVAYFCPIAKFTFSTFYFILATLPREVFSRCTRHHCHMRMI